MTYIIDFFLAGQLNVSFFLMAASSQDSVPYFSDQNNQQRSRYWVGTWQDTANPPSPQLMESKNLKTRYMVFQMETAPTTGKLHYQCYFEFEKDHRLCQLKKLFPLCYWGKRRGTAQQCIDYCTKEETRTLPPMSFGEPFYSANTNFIGDESEPAGKKPSTLNELAGKLVKRELNVKDAALAYPKDFILHYNGIRQLITTLNIHRTWVTHAMVLWGCPASGKSRFAREFALKYYSEDDIYAYDRMVGTNPQEWWDGYTGQKCVIIEEMDGRFFSYDRIKHLLDRYPMKVPFKGGSTNFLAEIVIMNSNFPVRSWYPDEPDINALLRRIDMCYHYCYILGSKRPLRYELVLDLENMCPIDPDANEEWIAKINIDCGAVVSEPQPIAVDLDPRISDVTDEDVLME